MTTITRTTGTKGMLGRSIKRALRALAYAFAARWLQKYGITIPVPEAAAVVADPAILSGALNVAVLMGLDKGLREKWGSIKRFLTPGD